MGYTIEPLAERSFPSLVELLHQSFAIENPDKAGLVSWKLLHPFHQNRAVSVIALDDTRTVVGHYSNIPTMLRRKDKDYQAMMCVDMSTHPNHRGKGLISQMAASVYPHVRHQGYVLTIGFSNTDGLKVDTHARGYGYTIIGAFTRYLTIPLPQQSGPISLVPVVSFDRQVEYDSSFPYIRIKKTRDYLIWRYVLRPHQDYHIYEIQEGSLFHGYLILRFIGRKCYLYDLCVPNYQPAAIRKIISALEQMLWEKRAALLIINVLDNYYWQSVFPRYRYWKTTKAGDAYYLTVKIHDRNLPTEEIFNRNTWFLVNGDIL